MTDHPLSTPMQRRTVLAAAAATGVSMGTTSVHTWPEATFRADHPFLFVIREVHSGAILFVGKVVDPAA